MTRSTVKYGSSIGSSMVKRSDICGSGVDLMRFLTRIEHGRMVGFWQFSDLMLSVWSFKS